MRPGSIIWCYIVQYKLSREAEMCSGQEWLRSANCMFIVNVFYSDHVVVFQGWFSPGQVFVLDEYCARYGVRGCNRHLCYLKDLMDFSENNTLVDPTLLHYSYAFCASHVHGNRYYSRFTNAGLFFATFHWHSIYIYAFGFNPLTVTPIFENSRESAVSKLKLL